MSEDHEQRVEDFEEAVWVALEGWEVLSEDWGESVRMADELQVFSSHKGTGVAVVLEGFSTEDTAKKGVDAILNHTGSAPEPDEVRISEIPYQDGWWVRFRFIDGSD